MENKEPYRAPQVPPQSVRKIAKERLDRYKANQSAQKNPGPSKFGDNGWAIRRQKH